ncbi:MAG: hypothetical protein ACRDRO_04120 [Pseudonocardiaceae bacterium]
MSSPQAWRPRGRVPRATLAEFRRLLEEKDPAGRSVRGTTGGTLLYGWVVTAAGQAERWLQAAQAAQAAGTTPPPNPLPPASGRITDSTEVSWTQAPADFGEQKELIERVGSTPTHVLTECMQRWVAGGGAWRAQLPRDAR